MKRLVEMYPKGLSVQDDHGYFPIHRFCKRQEASLDAVKFLLGKHPEGISARNGRGELPLHCALYTHRYTHRASLQLIQYLIEAYPEAVNATDAGGNLPPHAACFAGVSLDVLQLLLDRYTGDEKNHRGLSVTNNNGLLPLHFYAYCREPDTGAFQQLLDLYPQGIHVAERERGLLPLHVACFNPFSVLNLIRLLVEADLYTIVRTSRNGETPYQIARSLDDRNVEIETYLIEKQNEAVAALKEACEHVGVTQLGLPDLVVAQIWSFAKPDL